MFANANRKCINTINCVLNDFCRASSQAVSKEKLTIYFSKSVTDQEARILSMAIWIPRAFDLGRYLGVPFIHGRVTTRTYWYIMDKMLARLCSWQAQSLSFAGRLTLTQSMLTAIPLYTMQSTKIPKACLQHVESLCRKFLWGANTNE